MSDDDFKIHQVRRPQQNSQEQFIKDIQAFMKKLGFGGGGGGGRGGGGGDGKGTGFGIAIVALLIVAYGTLSSFYTIEVEEEGVITRFGAYERTTQPGLHFKIPFGIETIIKVPSKRILQEEFGFRTANTSTRPTSYDKEAHKFESLMLTGDLNVADVEWIIQYRISDAWKFLYNARNVRRNIRDVSMSIMRRVVGDRLVSDVLTTGRVEIAAKAKELTQAVLNQYDMGIHIEKVILQDVNPPEIVKPAFNDVNTAKQEQEQTINNAERQYNKIIPEARGKGEKLIADAEAYSIDIVNRSKGDASRFNSILKEYKKAPQITRQRLYIETMEEILSKVAKFTIIDSKVKGVLPVFSNGNLGMPTAAATK